MGQQSENGTPELTASLQYDARAVDADSNGIFENVTVTFHAEKTVYTDGSVSRHEWVTYEYHGQDLDQDGTMDDVSLLVEAQVATGA